MGAKVRLSRDKVKGCTKNCQATVRPLPGYGRRGAAYEHLTALFLASATHLTQICQYDASGFLVSILLLRHLPTPGGRLLRAGSRRSPLRLRVGPRNLLARSRHLATNSNDVFGFKKMPSLPRATLRGRLGGGREGWRYLADSNRCNRFCRPVTKPLIQGTGIVEDLFPCRMRVQR